MLENITAAELGREFGLEVVGNAGCRLRHVSSLEEAEEGCLCFIRSSKYAKWLRESRASAIIVPRDLELAQNGKAFLISDNPYVSFAAVLEKYYATKRSPVGVSPLAFVAASARVGADVSIEPFVFVGEEAEIGERSVISAGVRIGARARIGSDAVIHANVTIEEDTVIGKRAMIHSGAVIGSEGFGFTQTAAGNVKLPQIGFVEIGDDVEIGANTTVDRGALGKTVIGDGTKIDNLVQIAHGVRLGRHNVICAQCGIAGSVTTGDKVIFASRAGVGDHIRIGSGVTIGPLAGVTKDLPDGAVVSGFPAMPHQEWLKMKGLQAQLPLIREEMRNLRKNS